MAVLVLMLRGVNLGSHNRVKMEDLRKLCESLRLRDVETYVQSGNVVFRTDEQDSRKLARRIEDGVQRTFGFRAECIVRTPGELRKVVSGSPFAGRAGLEPGRLLVVFLADEPSREGRAAVEELRPDPEELHLAGREIYIYFRDGIGRSKLSWVKIEKMLKTPATARNWTSVTKILEMAERLEKA